MINGKIYQPFYSSSFFSLTTIFIGVPVKSYARRMVFSK